MRLIGALVAVAVLALAAAGAAAASAAHRAERERDDGERATTSAVEVAERVTGVATSLRPLAAAIGANRATASAAPPAGFSAVGLAAEAGSRLRPVAGGIDGALLEEQAVVAAAGTARDTARLVVTPPLADGSIVMVVALYDDGQGGSVAAPVGRSTAERRGLLAGYVLAVVDRAGLVRGSSVPIRVLDDATLVAASEDFPGGDVVEVEVSVVAQRRWTVQAPMSDPGTPTAAVLLVLAGLALAGVTLATSHVAASAAARAAEVARRRSQQALSVRRFAAIVQHSLDLADVLPAAAVAFADELGVTGVALTVFGADRARGQLFTFGDVPQPEDGSGHEVHDHVPAGTWFTVPMRSGGRTIAQLDLRAGPPLDAFALESVQAVSELLTATLVNARAFERQQEAIAAMRSLDELKTVFLGVASHELRTPVTAISGFSRLLRDRWDVLPDEERRLLVSRIDANAAGLGSLVQDMLDFSLLERDRMAVGEVPVDLGASVAAVIDRLAPNWQDHRIELTAPTSPTVLGDTDTVERIVANLVGNAVKFSPRDHAVRVSVGEDGDWAELVVDDEGPGVPAAERDRIFSRFFRGAGPEVVRTRGAGIGLSLVKELATRMGGDVTVGDSPAGGARFVVRFPLAPRAASVADPSEEAP